MSINRIEIKDGDIEELATRLKAVLESRPPNSNSVIFHISPDDSDDLITAIKAVKHDFFKEKVLPIVFVMPDEKTESQMMSAVAVAFKFACERLSNQSDKTASEWMERLLSLAIIAEEITSLEIFKEGDLL